MEKPQEWNQWRGADRSGHWLDGPEVERLTPDMVESLWEAEISPGYTGPTLSDGSVFLMDYFQGSERVLSFDAGNGDPLWEYSYPVAYEVGYPTGPRASVLVSDGKAYTWGTMGHLHCLDARTGEVLWAVDAREKFAIRIPIWGLASNPILIRDKLIVQVGGTPNACLVAFHKDTGEEIWRSLDDEASYSPPTLIRQAGREVLVCWTGESFSGLDPETGALYWSVPFEPGKMIMNISDPVYDPPYLFFSGFFDGAYLLELGQESLTANLVWHRRGESEKVTDAIHCVISTPLVREGYIYGIGSYGETRCLELASGDRVWEDLTLVPRGRWANVHLVPQDEKVWGFNEVGELLLGSFSPEGYADLGRVKVIDPVRISPNPRNGVTWAHPAFSGDRIFLRSDAKLVCIRIKSR